MSRMRALEAAFDGAEAGQEGEELTESVTQALQDEAPQEQQPPEQPGKPAAPREERIGRQPDGKFTRAPAKAAKAPAEDPYSKPPKSWKADFHGQYATLSPEVRAYLHQREEEQNKGVEPLKQRAQRADMLEQSLGPVMQDLQARGVGVDAFLRDIAQTVQTLAHGTLEQKVATLNNVARQYGVVAAQQMAQTGDPALARIQAQLQGLEARIRAEDQAREQAEWDAVATSINDFSQDTEKYPHFETVRVTMGRLIQTGEAKSLESAYTKAIRLHDDIWTQEQERQRAAEAQSKRETALRVAQNARRAAVSPRSGAPTGTDAGSGNKMGRREALESAFESIGVGGRV